MPMPSKHLLFISTILSVILFLTSVSFNIFFYRQGYEYYLQVNQIRLDPLGLSIFPIGKQNNTRSHENSLAVFIGDSRAAHWTVPTNVANFTFINRGINAQTTAQVLGRFAYHILPLEPDTLIIQVGINDLKTIPLFPNKTADIVAKCKAHIQEMVELTVQNNTRVVLTTIFPLGELPIERRPFWSDNVAIAVNDVNRFILELAGNKVKVLDTGKILSNKEGIIVPRYSKDFLHLNQAGYEVLNRELVQILQPS
jgi:lysophospholipase L1-like esterase